MKKKEKERIEKQRRMMELDDDLNFKKNLNCPTN